MDRVPQRKYSPRALEQWFQRLCGAWEGIFSDPELEAARQAYREGAVRSIELADDHAIVHGGRSRDDIYAVVDWPEGQGPSVRFSVEDRLQGRALAAAGLYEIEELVADEVEPVEVDEASNGHGPPSPVPLKEPAGAPEAPPEPPARPLEVRLSGSARGLRLSAFWDASSPRPDNAFRGGRLTPRERESLIALTSQARKARFEPRTYNGDYLLRDPDAIVAFVREELPRWKRRFTIETDDTVKRLGAGVRTARLRLRVERNGRGMRYQWSGRLGRQELLPEVAQRLLRHPRETLIDPKLGLIRLEANQSQWVTDWQPVLEDRFEGVLPFYMLFSLQAQREIPVLLSHDLESWREAVEAGAQRGEEDLPEVLRPYQRAGVEWMRHLLEADCHPLLADEMGLGKTLQMLSLLHADPRRKEQASLIVCPASVLPVWEAEAGRFFPGLELRRLHGGSDFGGDARPVVWLSSYTQLRRHRDQLGKREFLYAVLDEAQVIKNPEAKVSHACWAIRARHRLALTGTPIENRPLDVWTIFRYLMPGLLGSRRAFEEPFARDEVGATARLRRQLAPFVLRRTKAEVGTELPAKVEMALPCDLTEVQVAEYKRLVAEGSRELGENTQAALSRRPLPLLTLLTRLRQTCCDPGLLPWREDDPSQSGKLLALCERLEAVVSTGRKAVVFSQFVRLLDRTEQILDARFPDVPRFRLEGRTVDRARPVRNFQEGPGPALMLVSLKAGGTGITLHAADYVFLLDPWWNPAVEAQAIDRVHRIGQTRRVMVYRLITRGTVEERIEALKDRKRAQFDAVVGAMEGAVDWATQFSRLSELIAYEDTA